jgi:RNAse (barnase) inhibitor barstar
VFYNTIKGMDIIGQEYVINKPLKDYKYNWIHSDQKSLVYAAINRLPVLLGPNLFVLPKDMPDIPAMKESIYLHPSRWCVDVWKYLKFDNIELKPWPAGIDWESIYKPKRKAQSKQVMIYFKERDPGLFDYVIKLVESKGFSANIVKYRYYKESDYLDIINSSLFGIWIGRQESQGIALQEALASDLPLIVIDATSFFDTIDENAYIFPSYLENFKTTTAEYFDNECGIKITSVYDLDSTIDLMCSDLKRYHPLNYVKHNLSLEKQAYELIGLLKEVEEKSSYKWIYSEKKNYINMFSSDLLVNKTYYYYLLKRKSNTAKRLILKRIRKIRAKAFY